MFCDIYIYATVCPRSSDPFYIVIYYIKCVTTSLKYSNTFFSFGTEGKSEISFRFHTDRNRDKGSLRWKYNEKKKIGKKAISKT